MNKLFWIGLIIVIIVAILLGLRSGQSAYLVGFFLVIYLFLVGSFFLLNPR